MGPHDTSMFNNRYHKDRFGSFCPPQIRADKNGFVPLPGAKIADFEWGDTVPAEPVFDQWCQDNVSLTRVAERRKIEWRRARGL